MKYEKIHGFFGTTGFATDIDGLTFPALLELFIQKRYKEQSVGKVVQAYQNKFSKRLGIPTLKARVLDLSGESGHFLASRVKRNANTVRCLFDEMCDTEELFMIVPHEVKHAEQEYLLHKYLYHKQIPSDQLGKAILIANISKEIAEAEGNDIITSDVDGYEDYYTDITELDAYLFSGEEFEKLIQKYKIFDNLDFHLYLKSLWFKLFSVTEYQREGTNNPVIRKAISRFDERVRVMRSGKYGNAIKSAIDEIISTGFDTKKAFETITRKFDKIAEKIILEDSFLKSKGVLVNFFENGKFNYGASDMDRCSGEPEIIGEFGIELDSEYAWGIDRFVQKGGHVYEDLVMDAMSKWKNEAGILLESLR